MTDIAARAAVRTRANAAGGGRRRPRANNAVAYVILTIGAVIMAFPFVWQIIASLSSNTEVQSVPPTFWPARLRWENYVNVFHRLPFLHQFETSVTITVIRTVAQILLCTLAGYAFARMRFRGRGILFGIVLPGLFSAFGTFLMRTAFIGMPQELEEAARLDGANPLKIFWKVRTAPAPRQVPGSAARFSGEPNDRSRPGAATGRRTRRSHRRPRAPWRR
ncbi:MAG: carbohydrate ABC transporter permease [Micrococcales bacterium]|nr:carbohydrate ABC transporter permease [Micrococcales bacterium]